MISPLVEMNYSRVKVPKLKVRRIGEWEDARTQSFTLRNYVGASLIRPDDVLEKYLREENDLPEIDFATRQEVVAPQDPGQEETDNGTDNDVQAAKPARVGPPRQGRPTPGAPASNGGKDGSGRG